MNVIRELADGSNVLLSSHILSEIERITEQIVILHQGRLLAIGNLHAIREQLDNIPHTIEIECGDAKALARDVLVRCCAWPSVSSSSKLKIFTHHLGEFHQRLPKLSSIMSTMLLPSTIPMMTFNPFSNISQRLR